MSLDEQSLNENEKKKKIIKNFQDGGSVKSSRFETIPLNDDDVTKLDGNNVTTFDTNDVTDLRENGITKVEEIGKEDN